VLARDLLGFSAVALSRHRLRSVLSLLGVTIGVASVILLTALGDGARLFVVSEFAELGTNLLVVLPGKTETTGAVPLFGGVPNDLTLDDLDAIRKQVPSIRRIAPLTLAEAEARFRDRRRDVSVVGTTAEMLPIRHMTVHVGRFLPPGDPRHGDRVCVVGAKLQTELFGDANPLGQILHVGDERFRVIGVIAPRGMAMGMDLDEMVEIPVAQHMRMFNIRSLFRVLAEVTTHENIPRARREVIDLIAERHGEEDITILTQDAVLGSFTSILNVLTAAIAGIAAVSLTVAGVAIMNVMLVSVSERTAEIGLLKAVGVTRRQVVAAFLVEAALLSTIGGVLGLALGRVLAEVCGIIWPSFPVHVPSWAAWAALGTSLAVGLAFGSLPALRAAKLDPVAALARR
jgi:putative ABC transport system permease protein